MATGEQLQISKSRIVTTLEGLTLSAADVYGPAVDRVSDTLTIHPIFALPITEQPSELGEYLDYAARAAENSGATELAHRAGRLRDAIRVVVCARDGSKRVGATALMGVEESGIRRELDPDAVAEYRKSRGNPTLCVFAHPSTVT